MHKQINLRPIIGLDEKVYNDFFDDLICYENKSINQILNKELKYSYFKDQMVTIAESIIWNLGIYNLRAYAKRDYIPEQFLINEKEMREIFNNIDKAWVDISLIDIFNHTDEYLFARNN